MCIITKQTLTDGQDTNKKAYKNATDQRAAVAPGHKLCNNTHTNQEYHWTMTTRAVPNHMTVDKATERTKEKR